LKKLFRVKSFLTPERIACTTVGDTPAPMPINVFELFEELKKYIPHKRHQQIMPFKYGRFSIAPTLRELADRCNLFWEIMDHYESFARYALTKYIASQIVVVGQKLFAAKDTP